MAELINRKSKLFETILDWIWPRVTGAIEPPPKDQDCFKVKHSKILEDVHSTFSSVLAQGEERDKNVESKLAAQLTLTSVLSVAVIAGVTAAMTLGRVQETDKIFGWLAITLVSYALVQLLLSLRATVAGLTRRSYRRLSPEDMIPINGENTETYRTRLRNLQVNNMRWNDWVVNQKVSEMAVAHVAFRNALIGTFGIVVLAVVIASLHLV